MIRRTAVPAEFVSGPDRNDSTPSSMPMATAKQLSFIRSLLAERDIPEPAREQLSARVESGEVTKRRASDFIERLLKAPKRQGARPGRYPVRFQLMELDDGKSRELGFVSVGGREVPQGKYAIRTGDLPAGDWANDIALFNLYVAQGDDGPFYSLKMYVSDDLVRIATPLQAEVLKLVAKDPAAASALYGLHRVRCGICNRKLTADESRERGIGPVCAERLGW